MTSDKKSYRQIMKTTYLFGGVQVINIIISIVRSKFIAVLLGPLGMGIAGLLNSNTNFIGSITNFGLGTSAIRDISAAYSNGNEDRIAKVISVFRRLVWITGSLGMLCVIFLAPWLSKITFGNKNYTFAFILISSTLLFSQISSGQDVLLQGTRQLKYLARAMITGSIVGLLTTIPLYFFLRIKGIVPAIIINALSILIITWYYARKIKIKKVKVTLIETFAEGKGMMQMGFMISLSGLITTGVAYILRIYISNTGGVEQVGLYNAGFAIITTYVGMVFTAMSKDYYPRLSAVAYSNELCRETINQQAEIAILILAPIILVFIVFIKFIITILYSERFLPINNMIHWAILGIIFQGASWSIGFILLAKSASKLFFWNELIAASYMLLYNILGYKLWGLTGLGIAFLIGYVTHLFQMIILTKVKYEFNFNNKFIRIFSMQLLIALICFIQIKFLVNIYSYIIGIMLIIISFFYSYKELDKRLDLKAIILKLKIK
ncbi:MAG: O-antigen translocase [Ignavibacterium sp.]